MTKKSNKTEQFESLENMIKNRLFKSFIQILINRPMALMKLFLIFLNTSFYLCLHKVYNVVVVH